MKKSPIIFLVLFIVTIGLRAEENSHSRFQIELYGGLSSANPADLNLALAAEEKYNYFYYNNNYYYLERINYINSFSYTRTGAYKSIRNVMPFGLRIRANVGSTFAFSFGIKYLNKRQRSYPKEEFIFIENSGATSHEILDYSPIQLEIRSLSFYAGLHIGLDLGRLFRIEGYLTAGPTSGEFTYSYVFKDNIHFGDSGIEINNEVSQELQGKGKGFAWDAGVQLFMNLTKQFRLFLSGGYNYQQIKSLSGQAWQNAFGYRQYWDGEICLINEPHYAPWGYEEITFLSNNELLLEYYKDRNMRLDLSGFSINIGIAFRLR